MKSRILRRKLQRGLKARDSRVKIRLLQIRGAQIACITGVVWFQFQRFLKFPNAALRIAYLQQRKSQIVVRIWTFRPQLGYFSERS